MEPKIDAAEPGRLDRIAEPGRPRAAGAPVIPLTRADHRPSGEEASGVRMPSGRTVRLVPDGDEDLLHVSSPSGDVEMEIRFTESGPVLRFPSAALRLESDRDVDVACHDFRVRAGGSVDISSAGEARFEGHGVELQSRRTDVRVRANDDVRVEGERVLLNC